MNQKGSLHTRAEKESDIWNWHADLKSLSWCRDPYSQYQKQISHVTQVFQTLDCYYEHHFACA